MNIEEFFNNPAGKGAAMLNIKATKADYDKRYNSFFKSITHKIFFVKDDIYILVKIPSSVDGILYDVVIKFYSNSKSGGKSILDMDFQIFSNSPSFIYTYAHTYAKRNLLIKELNRKLSRQMIKETAVSRNPYNVISYDYTVYCAIKYILSNGYTNIDELKLSDCIVSKSLTPLYRSIPDWDTLQKKRGIQKSYNKFLKEEEENEKKNKIKYKSNKDNDNENNTGIKDVKNIKNVKKTSKTKKVKKIK